LLAVLDFLEAAEEVREALRVQVQMEQILLVEMEAL
jgi:hypothetical protein